VQLAYFKPTDFSSATQALEKENLKLHFIAETLYVAPRFGPSDGKKNSEWVGILNKYFYEQKADEEVVKSVRSTFLSKSRKKNCPQQRDRSWSQEVLIGFKDKNRHIEYAFGKLDHCHYILFSTYTETGQCGGDRSALRAEPSAACRPPKNTSMKKRSEVSSSRAADTTVKESFRVADVKSSSRGKPPAYEKSCSLSRIRETGYLQRHKQNL
jgi:hypothetical protein